MKILKDRLRVALLSSERAVGLEDLLRDPSRGVLYDLVCCVTSESELHALQSALRAEVPCVAHSIHAWFRDWHAPLSDMTLRAEYDGKTAKILSRSQPDLVLLSGYNYRLTEGMLTPFKERILGVHGGDLSRKDGHGKPLYAGLNPVRTAILAGERETRATVHLVTEGIGEGPGLIRSWPFPVAMLARDALRWGATDILTTYALAHSEWMLRLAWGPLLVRSVEVVAMGRTRFCPGAAWIDHIPGPWGLRLGRGETILEPPLDRLPITVGVWGD